MTKNGTAQSRLLAENYESEELQWCDIISVSSQRRIITMSLAIVLAGKDSIVVASDSRETVTFGDLTSVEDNINKIKVVSDSIAIIGLGNLAGYCNYLLTYFVNKELIDSGADLSDVESFTDKFSKWASVRYKNATQGMPQILLNSLDNHIEIIIAGYTKKKIPQIYVLSNEPNQPALIPNLVDIPYHISGIVSVGKYWLKKTSDLTPVSSMSVEALKKLPLLMIKETSQSSIAVSLPMNMVVLNLNTPYYQLTKDEIALIESSLNRNMDIDRSLKRLLEGG